MEKELADIRKEIVEARNLVIKNDNLCERLSMHWDEDLPAECVVIIQPAEEALAA